MANKWQDLKKYRVPFKLAVKLKEIGFDNVCDAVYLSENEYYQESGISNYPPSRFPDVVPAPLWQQAFEYVLNMKPLDPELFLHFEEGQWVLYCDESQECCVDEEALTFLINNL